MAWNWYKMLCVAGIGLNIGRPVLLENTSLVVLFSDSSQVTLKGLSSHRAIMGDYYYYRDYCNNIAGLLSSLTLFAMSWPYHHHHFPVADPGFPVGGVDLVGGRGLPRWLHFIKFVCQNERIGSFRGARAGCAPWIRQCFLALIATKAR